MQCRSEKSGLRVFGDASSDTSKEFRRSPVIGPSAIPELVFPGDPMSGKRIAAYETRHSVGGDGDCKNIVKAIFSVRVIEYFHDW